MTAVAASETGSSFLQGKMPGKSPGVGKNHLVESSQPSPSLTHAGSSVNRPSSNYNTRLQQVIGPQKGIYLLFYFFLDLFVCCFWFGMLLEDV